MSRTRRISYQWRLFFPLVITLWVLLLGLAGWQCYHEREYRRQFVSNQLQLINQRIVEFIEQDQKGALGQFLSFLDKYYNRLELFDNIRISVYDRNMKLVEAVGSPIVPDTTEQKWVDDEVVVRSEVSVDTTAVGRTFDREYYYMGKTTSNGMTVIAALPNDEELVDYLSGHTTEVWMLIFGIALVMTVVCYLSTRYLGRNIRILRDFANRSANDPWFTPGTDFPHDELGDIAREIVRMYNERAMARKRTEREHRMALHSIEEKARQKRQLTSNINHELKTPIGVIKGYLDTIVDNPDMDEETRNRFVRNALDHTNRLVDIITDISAITRLEDNPNKMSTELIDFHELVFVFVSEARESGVLGHFDFDFDVPIGILVCGNHNLLVGMLLNLTKNAVNYSHGSRCVIEYRGEDDRFYRFAYYDDGVGVPPESLEHLFDRFYRIDSGRSRKMGGTGLGLAIVYNTVKAHGGTITVKNRESGGLEFEFTLLKGLSCS